MDLTWIEDFFALLETESFSRAAMRRNVTQPAFSRRIRALEDWVGVTLFDRTSHRVALTPSGSEFRPEAAELLRRASIARERARDAVRRSTSTVRFASTHLLASTFFPGWLTGLELKAGREFPFQFLVDHMVACERLMLRNEASILLCHHHDTAGSELEDGSFRRVALAQDRLVPVSVPDANGAPLHKLAVAGETAYLEHRAESGLARILARSGLRGRVDDRLRPVFHAHAALTLLSMVRAGRGMTWIPASAIVDDLACGRLVPAADAEHELPIEICLIRPNDVRDESLCGFLSVLEGRADGG